jgi:hypothetical protein
MYQQTDENQQKQKQGEQPIEQSSADHAIEGEVKQQAKKVANVPSSREIVTLPLDHIVPPAQRAAAAIAIGLYFGQTQQYSLDGQSYLESDTFCRCRHITSEFVAQVLMARKQQRNTFRYDAKTTALLMQLDYQYPVKFFYRITIN